MPSGRRGQGSDARKKFKRRINEAKSAALKEEERLETLRWTTNGDFPRDIRKIGSMQFPLCVMIPEMEAFLDHGKTLVYKMPPWEYMKNWFCEKVMIFVVFFTRGTN